MQIKMVLPIVMVIPHADTESEAAAKISSFLSNQDVVTQQPLDLFNWCWSKKVPDLFHVDDKGPDTN